MKKIALCLCMISMSIETAFTAQVSVDLSIIYKNVYFAGKARNAIAVNNQILAPTLHF
ncbi:MAG: hypothetical protein LEGION0403_FIIPPAGN_01220 [Legionella sp.]|uniref:hypothetical protein n=1 Tax=Legionella sp. TaxID=459 RepID=UPI003D13D53B